MSNVPFGAETIDAPWNQPDGADMPRCANCGKEAERDYPDQEDCDVEHRYADQRRHRFCTRDCAMQSAMRGKSDALKDELAKIYNASAVLSDLSPEAVELIKCSDLRMGTLDLETHPAPDITFSVVVTLSELQGLACRLTELLGGAFDDPKWIRKQVVQ